MMEHAVHQDEIERGMTAQELAGQGFAVELPDVAIAAAGGVGDVAGVEIQADITRARKFGGDVPRPTANVQHVQILRGRHVITQGPHASARPPDQKLEEHVKLWAMEKIRGAHLCSLCANKRDICRRDRRRSASDTHGMLGARRWTVTVRTQREREACPPCATAIAFDRPTPFPRVASWWVGPGHPRASETVERAAVCAERKADQT